MAVVFRCADAGMPSAELFDQQRRSLMVVSTWGHVVDIGVLATLEYAVATLKTPLIVILGHSDCAAMQTALESWNTVTFPDGTVRAVVEHAIASLARQDASISNADELAAANVAHTGVSLLHKSPVIAKAVDSGESAIVCLVSDGDDGRLRVCATFGAVSPDEAALLECV
ncbi:carbonic anhydrase [Mycobacterium sp.]|uniref:carbonic anhydrase n=1 Tax=Mycobacterium sp. TaxID=1785 RepID=UPI0025D1401F|nr:carbonic anhydrase [Mycobacterium sp.]